MHLFNLIMYNNCAFLNDALLHFIIVCSFSLGTAPSIFRRVAYVNIMYKFHLTQILLLHAVLYCYGKGLLMQQSSHLPFWAWLECISMGVARQNENGACSG